MNIPYQVELGQDGIIIDGTHKGTPHHYKTSLYNTLLALKPKNCLEIGTLHGGTARVFRRYFEEHQPDGLLITADLKLYCNLDMPGVVQVRVYPHVERYYDLHNVTESDLLPNGANLWRESVRLNKAILENELYRCATTLLFDFAFIDGDHRAASLEKDIAICKAVTKPPHYILLEDVREGIHESSKFYADTVVHEWAHYDFEDWPVLSGTALIWEETCA